jgi:hypothetical protein
MEEQKNNIRVIFTAKANSALDTIIKNYNLEEDIDEFIKKRGAGKFSNEVTIDHLAKDFAVGKISKEDLTNSLQKELAVTQQISEQISKEIITNIIPFLEKVSEEKLKDPVFQKELEKKVFNETAEKIAFILDQKKEIEDDIFPKINSSPNSLEQIKKINTDIPQDVGDSDLQSLKNQEKIKKISSLEKTDKPTPPRKRSKGPDIYREPIE